MYRRNLLILALIGILAVRDDAVVVSLSHAFTPSVASRCVAVTTDDEVWNEDEFEEYDLGDGEESDDPMSGDTGSQPGAPEIELDSETEEATPALTLDHATILLTVEVNTDRSLLTSTAFLPPLICLRI